MIKGNMKILVIGDVHGTTFWKSCKEKINDYDHIVQVGDWFDDWENHWNKVDQIKNLQEALYFEAKYRDKVHILLGNHDLNSYLMDEPTSGHQDYKEVDICLFLRKNTAFFDIACEIGGYVFSHAGFTKTWMNLWKFKSVDDVNKAFHEGFYKPFSFCGFEPSGDDWTQGPTWVRLPSLISDAYFKKQIVGHTPLPEPPFIYQKDGLDIRCVDSADHSFQYELIVK